MIGCNAETEVNFAGVASYQAGLLAIVGAMPETLP